MKKKWPIVVIVLIAVFFLIWVTGPREKTTPSLKEKAKVSEIKEKEEPVQSLPVEDFEKLYSQAKKLISEGSFLEAKEIYKRLIQEFPDNSRLSKLESELWDLNIKILFSPLKDEYSTVYEVQPGDTLSSIARKFKTTVGLIKKSNNLTSDIIRPGQRLKILTAKVSIIVDKSQNKLFLKINDEIFKAYPCSTGQFNSTPTGKFKIVNKLIDPVWFKAGAIVPPESPENILGTRWLGLDLKGYGIHGTTQPETIGKQVTQGCIRMYNKDVEELFDIVPVGTEVIIID